MKAKFSIVTIFLTLLISACAEVTPQATPEPATATETSLPPTQIPSTDTSVPPTDSPVAATEPPASSGTISFTNDVLPILQTSCTECHGVKQIKEGLDLTTHDGIIAGSFNGPVLNPGNADDSYLVQQIIEGEMPKRGPKLTEEQIRIITDWVNQGALNN